MKNKVIKSSLILIAILSIVFCVSKMVKHEIVTVQGSSTEVNAAVSIGTLAKGEKNPSTYGYNIHTGTFTVYKGGNSFNFPTLGGYQLYCINPAYSLDYAYQITWADANALNGKKYYSTCDCASQPRIGQKTPISYSEDAAAALSPAAAYIVSDTPIGGWSEDKQRGLWNLRNSGYDGGMILNNFMSPHSGSSSYDKVAIDYANYDDKVRNKGLKPTDGTNPDNMKVLVDADAKEYTVGPFNVKYTNGIYGNIAFSGISEMKIVGYNGNREFVRDDIKIEKIILKDQATGIYGKTIIPQYFEPSSNLKVDKTTQVYPASGQDFKVVFKNPNTGSGQQIEYISIKVKFKYMLANGMYTKLNGVKVEIVYNHDHSYNNPHIHYYSCGGCIPYTYSCGGCVAESYSYTCSGCTPDMVYYCDQPGCSGHFKGYWCPGHSGVRYSCPGTHIAYYCPGTHTYNHNGCITTAGFSRWTQQWLGASDAIRSIYEQEIELLADSILNPNDNRLDNLLDITMEIEGDVWEDKKTGKDNSFDGRKGDYEPVVSGIPVILYSTDGRVLKRTTTDKNGAYEFDRLDAMKKYYVEFRYNGQEYQNTKYTNNLSGGYSNATESKNDRDSFNKKFEEIDGDEGYKLEDLAKYYPNNPFSISAYTGSDGKNKLQTYPKYTKFVVLDKDETVAGVKYEGIYEKGDNQKEVDFGIAKRNEFDIALKKDIYSATVKINGKTEVYGYDKKNIGSDDNTSGDTWNIQEVINYDREFSNDDYSFAGQNGNNQLLEVYITYKIAVRNQSQAMLGHVTKLYDYYDSTYEYKPELSWMSNTNYRNDTDTLNKLQNSMEKQSIEDSEWGVEPKVIANENSTLTIDVNKKQGAGETVYLYLTFKVKGQGSDLALSVKGNSAKIGAFKTYYKQGTILPHYGENNFIVPDDNMIAGRIDKDFIPSGIDDKEISGQDGEDKAPDVNVGLTGEVRKITGTVWEDQRTLKSGDAVIGNGIRDEGEIGIAGVKVQLWEKTAQGVDCLWYETVTDENGRYTFEGFVAGNYYVRFYYGHTKEMVTNEISYNGQDYKSTSYQAGIVQNEYTDDDNKFKGYIDVNTQNESNTYGYDITESEKVKASDAKDIWTRREEVNKWSNNNGNGVKNSLAETLVSPYETPKYNGNSYSQEKMDEMINELMTNTWMVAETGVIVVEVEKDMQSNLENGVPSYILNDIDLGLEERPKAQLEIDKSIANVRVTLANGSVLFDVNKSGNNVIWKTHEPYNLSENIDGYGKYESYYGETDKNRYSYRKDNNYPINTKDKGLVQLTMDEEIMHGATIQITYKVKVTNVGEVDYEEQKFYYLGNAKDTMGNIDVTTVTTTANQVVDYVANNLQYDKNKNSGWNIITKNELINQGLVNSKLSSSMDKFNIIIQTEELNKPLKPNESIEKKLVLSQLISIQNTEDDLTYSNIVEIVKTNNTVGRRMAYSIVGNQDPDSGKAEEIDSNISERVIILPPFGEMYILCVLGIMVGIILIAGITLIVKKVLKK